jgi:hypothetical protein
MSFIKEVTYKDSQTSHWVANIIGHHEWDAVNDNWKENRQIGWRSIDGLSNSGTVIFDSLGDSQTRLTAVINYDPPAGILGDIGESLGVGGRFERALTQDLNHFAEMVNQAPPGALNPASSSYLFHSDSAASRGQTTDAQEAAFARADFLADDTPVAATATPQDINQAFPTNTREDSIKE